MLEKLKEENARLRAALEKYAKGVPCYEGDGTISIASLTDRRIAIEALRETKTDN